MFQVQQKQCSTCIYRKDSPLDLTKLENDIKNNRGEFNGHRICHHSKTACCAGFWAKHKDDFQLGQIAQRLKAVEFVEHDIFEDEKKFTEDKSTKILTAKQASRLFNINERTVRLWCQKGKIRLAATKNDKYYQERYYFYSEVKALAEIKAPELINIYIRKKTHSQLTKLAKKSKQTTYSELRKAIESIKISPALFPVTLPFFADSPVSQKRTHIEKDLLESLKEKLAAINQERKIRVSLAGALEIIVDRYCKGKL